ncbi:MAG TPA: ABC transporter permease [Phycisphaerales bacterium]|nr:ABC transporter permease [Phycisphaerales bacterium]
MSDQSGTIPGAAGKLLHMIGPVLGLVLVIAIFAAIPPHHGITLLQLQTILVHTVGVGIVALGMTVVIAGGGIDLSVGSTVALCGVVAAVVLDRGHGLPAAISAAIFTGVLCGAYNGLLITLLRLPPFIATLGTLGFYRGVAKWIAGSSPVSPDTLYGLDALVLPTPPAEFSWLGVAPSVWLMLILACAVAITIRATVFGRRVLAVGGNETAARYAGISLARVKVQSYILLGGFAGLAGVLQMARLTQGDPTVSAGLELDVIAAVVIGGASLAGGSASIAGTLCGALMMAYLVNRCTLHEWQQFVQQMIVGHIIIAAVAFDLLRRRRG